MFVTHLIHALHLPVYPVKLVHLAPQSIPVLLALISIVTPIQVLVNQLRLLLQYQSAQSMTLVVD
jgi:hypothetical protein